MTTDALFTKDAKVADINGDGWPDIISASRGDNKIAWYKNSGLSISENEVHEYNYSVYPNPTNGIISIKSENLISEISVFNILNQRINTGLENNQIDLSNVNAGVYILRIQDENGNFQSLKVVKQ